MSRPRFWRLQLLAALIGLALITLFVLARFSDITGSIFVRTTVAQNGVIETSYTGAGLMVRSEIAVQAPVDGVATLLVEDGQRVRAGQIVAEVRQENRAQVTEALAQVDTEITSLDREAQRTADDMRQQIDQLRSDIQVTEAELASSLSSGRNDLANQYGTILDGMHRKLESLEKEFSAARSAVEVERQALMDERHAVLREMSSNAVRVVAAQPGVVSFAHDGYEERFTVGQALEDLWSFLESEAPLRSIGDGAEVHTGDTLFRLINNFTSHVFVRFDKPPELSQGQSVWLRWPDTEASGIRARVVSIHNRLDQVGAWFSIDTYQDRFAELRLLPSVSVITSTAQGVVIPRSSVIVQENRTGVYLVAGGSPVFRYVSVLASDPGHVIVDQVPPGSRVVTNPRRLLRSAEPY